MGALDRVPDVIMPSQFFEAAGAKTFSSEQRLMLAILADAVNILREYRSSPDRNKRRSFNEVSFWVFNAGIRSASYLPFDHVCDALGLNAENLRRRLALLVSEPRRNFRKLRLNASIGRSRGPTNKSNANPTGGATRAKRRARHLCPPQRYARTSL